MNINYEHLYNLMEQPFKLNFTADIIPNAYYPKQIIFNPPATIVFWEDGTKTIVKCYNEEFDEEKGYAMAVMKKLYKNRSKFNKIIENATRQESKNEPR